MTKTQTEMEMTRTNQGIPGIMIIDVNSCVFACLYRNESGDRIVESQCFSKSKKHGGPVLFTAAASPKFHVVSRLPFDCNLLFCMFV